MPSLARLFSLLILVIAAAAVGVVVVAWRVGISTSAAGMAAKNLCSGVFVAGRSTDQVITNDILPASVIMRLASMQVDRRLRTATASLPGTGERHAVYRGRLGCTLLGPGKLPDPAERRESANSSPTPTRSSTNNDATWPGGSAPPIASAWPDSVSREALDKAVASAFSAPGSSSTSPDYDGPAASSTRAVVIARNGQLLAERYAPGFEADTPQLGWSMAKTILSLLVWSRLAEQNLPLDTRVTDAMVRMPRPNWVGDWQRDTRAEISIDHLLTMRDGLEHEENYRPWSSVPRMLWSEPDIASWAGRAAATDAPGTTWRYSSAVSNLLSRVLRDQFASDRLYWQYPAHALFDAVGMTTAVLEADADGTFIGSSYAWASPRDWARLGQLILNDGRWGARQVVPPGWLAYALTPRTDGRGERLPYGAHVWQSHDSAQVLDCPGNVGIPRNGLFLLGHWGQVVAVFPDQSAVIVRLGWASEGKPWDRCAFVADVLSALGPGPQGRPVAAPTTSTN